MFRALRDGYFKGIFWLCRATCIKKLLYGSTYIKSDYNSKRLATSLVLNDPEYILLSAIGALSSFQL